MFAVYVSIKDVVLHKLRGISKTYNRKEVPLIRISKQAESSLNSWVEESNLTMKLFRTLWDNCMVSEGFIEIPAQYKDHTGTTGFYFKFELDFLLVGLIQDGSAVYYWTVSKDTGIIDHTENGKDVWSSILGDALNDLKKKHAAAMIFDVFCTLTFFRDYYTDKEIVHAKDVKTKKSKKTSKGKKKPSSVVYVTHRVYELHPESVSKHKVKLKGSWGVRGHWRHLKSGKRVWINKYVKGKGDFQDRTYNLTDI